MSDAIITASDTSLEELLNHNDKPILLDLWAPWCQPCKTLAPLLDTIADNTPDNLTVAKLDVEQYPALMQRFGVRGIPTLLLFKNGQEISRQIGVKTLAQLRGWLESHQITIQNTAQPLADTRVTWGAFYGDASLHDFLHHRLRQHAANGDVEHAFSPYWQDNKGSVSAVLAHSADIHIFERVSGLPAALGLLLEKLPTTTPAQVDALFAAITPGKAVDGVALQWVQQWLDDTGNPWSDWLADSTVDSLRQQWISAISRLLAGKTVAESEWTTLHQQAINWEEKASGELGLEKNIASIIASLSPPPAASDANSWRGVSTTLGFALAQILQIDDGWSREERATPDERFRWFKKQEEATPNKQLTDEQITALREQWLQENPDFSAKEDAFYQRYPQLLEQQTIRLQETLWELLRRAPAFKLQLD
ncbi:thioredoxin [Pectobacterium carotovorum]|uniref:thioredoxin n=1 Tax=Pectobacterium carotovorum TaxID=554 RepID=UPI0029DD6EC4|nr:thioredoxin [Pectobacterium carotovorum]MDX6913878.1 thioredoxin [Pectobacterium carotovorum]